MELRHLRLLQPAGNQNAVNGVFLKFMAIRQTGIRFSAQSVCCLFVRALWLVHRVLSRLGSSNGCDRESRFSKVQCQCVVTRKYGSNFRLNDSGGVVLGSQPSGIRRMQRLSKTWKLELCIHGIFFFWLFISCFFLLIQFYFLPF